MCKADEIPYHPRQCHLCKYNGVNALLQERGLPLCEEAARACLHCEFPGESNGGVSWVHIDAAANPDTVYANRIAPDYMRGCKADMDAVQSPCNPDERERYLRLIQMFAELNWDDAGLVSSMLKNMTIAEIAKMRNVSYESIFSRWQKIKRKYPAFGSLANGLMGLGQGRQSKIVQDELFDFEGGK